MANQLIEGGNETAGADRPATSKTGQPDSGVAQMDAKQVDPGEFKQEFGLDSNTDEVEPTDPVKETVVDTGDKPDEKPDEKPGEDQKPDQADEKVVTDEGDETVSVKDFLKDVDDDTRRDLFAALAEDPDAQLTFQRNGESVSQPVADVLRAASGYPGAEAVTARAGTLKKAEEQLAADQKQFSETLEDPQEFLDYMDGHIQDPVKFYTAIRDRADAVLKENEDDPAAFRRTLSSRRDAAASRQATAELRTEVAGLRAELKSGKSEGNNADEAVRQEGQTRRTAVEAAGFDVNVVDDHWTAAGSPTDFARWFGAWSKINAPLKGTPKSETTNNSTNNSGKKTGLRSKSLKRAGSVGSGVTPTQVDNKPMDAEGIENYLRAHPSNVHMR